MQIQQINNNKPAFTGYVGGSLKRVIEVNATKELTNDILYRLNGKEKPNTGMSWLMNRFTKGIINGLGTYMLKLEKKTCLVAVKGSENNYIALKNPITRRLFYIVKDKSGELSLSEIPKNSIGKFHKNDAPFSILEKVVDFLNHINKMDPDMINKTILNEVTKQEMPNPKNLFQKLRMHVLKRRISQYREDIKQH